MLRFIDWFQNQKYRSWRAHSQKRCRAVREEDSHKDSETKEAGDDAFESDTEKKPDISSIETNKRENAEEAGTSDHIENGNNTSIENTVEVVEVKHSDLDICSD